LIVLPVSKVTVVVALPELLGSEDPLLAVVVPDADVVPVPLVPEVAAGGLAVEPQPASPTAATTAADAAINPANLSESAVPWTRIVPRFLGRGWVVTRH